VAEQILKFIAAGRELCAKFSGDQAAARERLNLARGK